MAREDGVCPAGWLSLKGLLEDFKIGAAAVTPPGVRGEFEAALVEFPGLGVVA